MIARRPAGLLSALLATTLGAVVVPAQAHELTPALLSLTELRIPAHLGARSGVIWAAIPEDLGT